MSVPEIVIWGTGTPRTMRAYWALHELDVPFSRRAIRTRTSDMDAPAFLAVSPGRKIPAFECGDLRFTESGAIVSYLFDRFQREAGDPETRARIAHWSFFVLTEIDATALYVMRRHRDLPKLYGEAPAAVTAAKEYFARQAEVVSTVLEDGREFLCGDAMSAADIHLGTSCDWAVLYELALPDTLRAYQQRHQARPAYRAARRSNDPKSLA